MSTRGIIGRRIIHYDRVTSTNDLVREWAENGEPEGLVIAAEEQTAGRGRLGRQWIGPRGTSLQFSVLLRPPLAAAQTARLTPLAALALAATLREELGLRPGLKWPNDVLLNEKKCAGILVETSFEADRLSYAVLGVGLNVNYSMREFADLAPFATTLLDELGREVNRDALERAIIKSLDAHYARLLAGDDVFSEWRSQLTTLGRYVRVVTPNGIEEGLAEDIAPDGALVLRQEGRTLRLYAGDVTLARESTPRS